MLRIFILLIALEGLLLVDHQVIAQGRFANRADSLDWWKHRRFKLDGMKPYTRSEQLALSSLSAHQVLQRSVGRVRVNYRECDTSTVATRSFIGKVISRRDLVFFTVEDDSGYLSEQHFFDLDFLDDYGEVIQYFTGK